MNIIFTDEQRKFIKFAEMSTEYQELKTHRIECQRCHHIMLIPLVMSNDSVKMVNNLLGRMRTFYMKEGMYRYDIEDIIRKMKESGKNEDADKIRKKVFSDPFLDGIFNQALRGE